MFVWTASACCFTFLFQWQFLLLCSVI